MPSCTSRASLSRSAIRTGGPGGAWGASSYSQRSPGTPRRAVRRVERVVELRALARHPAPAGQRDEPDDGDAAQHEHVDVEDEVSTLGSGDEGDGGEDGREQPEAEDREELAAHATVRARSSSRTAPTAAIASSFILPSIECSLNFARSKRPVRRRAAAALPVSSASTRPRYSSGASAGLRGSPYEPSERSMRA